MVLLHFTICMREEEEEEVSVAAGDEIYEKYPTQLYYGILVGNSVIRLRMKFMKLGSKPDTFYTTEAITSVSTEVSTDLIILVNGNKYVLHKFPLLSKCLYLQRLCSECSGFSTSSQKPVLELPDFPSEMEAFEICVKFCYGISITLSALNIVSVRCAAEYLQMTEDVDKGNLISKLEAFLNSCILRGWKDSILTMQSTKSFPSWSEDLGITSRCIDAISSRVISCPSKLNFSYSFSKVGKEGSLCNGAASQRHGSVPQGWWAEDISEFSIDLYWRTIVAIKTGGKVPANLIGKALQMYAARWLPKLSKEGSTKNEVVSNFESGSNAEATHKDCFLLESIVSLLPMEKGSASTSFLLKLLKAANILGASSSTKKELSRRVGMQLEEAKVSDLLIPSMSYTNETMYDVDIVMNILEQFSLQAQSPPTSPPRARARYEKRRSRSAENFNFEFQESRKSSSASHSSKLKVAKLVDGYLQEIARDVHLPLSKMIALAEAIPDFTRPNHDDLYKAIAIYFKSHKDLNKTERKQLCRILDCKKLSTEVCMQAAQNELLPLRMVVQVLFIEQARASLAGGQMTELPNNIKVLLSAHEDDSSMHLPQVSTTVTGPAEEEWSVSGLNSSKSKVSTLRMKLTEDDNEIDDNDLNQDGVGRSSKLKSVRSIPARPKKMLSRLWSLNRTAGERL